uniref:G-protein coupled receptors family 1 profile domain-containing protein n=1 Tax=Gadus morhua TaxID=8049 RepID=A0A8C5FKG1_GADMO
TREGASEWFLNAPVDLDAGSSGGPGGREQNHTGLFSGTELLLRFKPLFLPLYCLLVAVAAVGNCFLLACISSDKKLHNATNFFIGNLAAGDLLMCLSCVPLTASYALGRGGWAFGRPLCHLVPLLQGATVVASALSLTAIAVDRYIVVAHPVRRRISVRGCGGVALGIWCLSLALAAPPSFYTRYLDLRPSGLHLVVCEEFWPSSGHLRLLYSCFILTASYMIPLLSVSVSYCAISGSLRRHALPGETSRSQERWSRRRRKTFSLLVASVLAFALCWLPLQVLNLLLDLDPDFHITGKRYINLLQVCCHLVAMSSTCYNPFIYASLHSKVRQHLKGYLCYRRRRAAPREGGADVHGETLTSPCASSHTNVYGAVRRTPGSTPCPGRAGSPPGDGGPAVAVFTDDARR